MFQVQNVTSDPRQRQSLVLPDGTQIFLAMKYVPLQIGWFLSEITYGAFTLAGVRIVNSPNLIYQFRNQVPFGIACFSTIAEREPTQLEDFSSGASKLFILTAEEVNQYAELLSGEV